MVAPFMGAWIEIRDTGQGSGEDKVAPFMGAWIEIKNINGAATILLVAPFMGAWIEIMSIDDMLNHCDMSHPSWVRKGIN